MISPLAELDRFVRAALLQPVSSADRPAPTARALRRRRLVAGLTILVGGVMLALTLRADSGSTLFFALGIVLAVIWACGAVASGPLRLGYARTRSGARSRAVVQSLALATMLLVVFLLGALAVAQIPPLRDPVLSLLDHGTVGPLPLVVLLTVVNGVAEEMFFRGALYSAVPPRHAVAVTTALYALTTVGSGVPLLVLAAMLLGLVTALQRRVTGGILGPIITHVTWSSAMLLLLPPVLNLAR